MIRVTAVHLAALILPFCCFATWTITHPSISSIFMDQLIHHLALHAGHHFAIEAGHALQERYERSESHLRRETERRFARQECKRLLLENGEILDVIDYCVKYERKGGYGLITSWPPCEDNSLVIVGKIGDRITASRVRGSLETGLREVVREGAAYSGSESWPAYVEPSALGSGFDEDSFLNVMLGLSSPAGPIVLDRKIDLTDLVLKA